MLHNKYKINSIYPLSSIIFKTNIEVHYETHNINHAIGGVLENPRRKIHMSRYILAAFLPSG